MLLLDISKATAVTPEEKRIQRVVVVVVKEMERDIELNRIQNKIICVNNQ